MNIRCANQLKFIYQGIKIFQKDIPVYKNNKRISQVRFERMFRLVLHAEQNSIDVIFTLLLRIA